MTKGVAVLGARIKTLRIRAGLRQSDIARAIGVTKGAISLWERGFRAPSAWAIRALEYVYGLSRGALLICVERKNPDQRR